METCTNCNRQIGNLEKTFLFDNHIVCADCNARLEESARGQPLMYEAPPAGGEGGGKTASLVLGIIGMVAWIIPIIGLPITIIGLVLGKKALNSSKSGAALAGVILSIIGLVLTVINGAIGAYLGATGQMFKR